MVSEDDMVKPISMSRDIHTRYYEQTDVKIIRAFRGFETAYNEQVLAVLHLRFDGQVPADILSFVEGGSNNWITARKNEYLFKKRIRELPWRMFSVPTHRVHLEKVLKDFQDYEWDQDISILGRSFWKWNLLPLFLYLIFIIAMFPLLFLAFWIKVIYSFIQRFSQG